MSIKVKRVLWWVVAIVGALFFLNITSFIFKNANPAGGKGTAAAGVVIGIILLLLSTRQLNNLVVLKHKKSEPIDPDKH